MTEKERNSKLNSMKSASIVCLIVVILMNMFSWVSFGLDPYGGQYIKESIGGIMDQYGDDDQLDMIQDQLDYADVDLEIEDFVTSADALFNPLMDLGLAPLDFVSMTIGFNGMLNFITSPELDDFVGYGFMGAVDEDEMLAMNIVRVALMVGAALPIIVCALAILHIVFHIINRKGLGISVPILTFINMIYMGFVWLVMVAGFSGMGSIAIPTLAPFISLVCGILASVFWGQARKYINMVRVEVPVQPQAPVQPAPQGQEPVQPAKRFCTNCGTQLDEGTKFCPNCGGAQ